VKAWPQSSADALWRLPATLRDPHVVVATAAAARCTNAVDARIEVRPAQAAGECGVVREGPRDVERASCRVPSADCLADGSQGLQTDRRSAFCADSIDPWARVQGLHSGVLVVVQRFRSDLGLFVHLHALATDGCFEVVGDDDVRFLPVEQLSPAHLLGVLGHLHRDLAEHLEDEGEPPDEAVAACVQLGLSRPPLRRT
jgi:hypothetical protein